MTAGMSCWFWETRGHIPFLETAWPAKQTYVRSLRPGMDFVRLLPLEIAPLLSEDANDVAEAIQKHKTWLDFYPQTQITDRTKTEMSLQMGCYMMNVEILAYGDFNHDGFEDVLVFFDHSVADGTFNYSGLAVLTRKSSSDYLKPVNIVPQRFDIPGMGSVK
jgi:hypothetical protein